MAVSVIAPRILVGCYALAAYLEKRRLDKLAGSLPGSLQSSDKGE